MRVRALMLRVCVSMKVILCDYVCERVAGQRRRAGEWLWYFAAASSLLGMQEMSCERMQKTKRMKIRKPFIFYASTLI